jgi:hypothetical protein
MERTKKWCLSSLQESLQLSTFETEEALPNNRPRRKQIHNICPAFTHMVWKHCLLLFLLAVWIQPHHLLYREASCLLVTKKRISRSVDGLLESYGPYKQNPITTTYKKVVLKIAGHCNFEGPLRLFICINMAPKWLGFCDIEPRYNLLSVGHSKPCVLTSILKGIHWCYSLPLLYFWGVFSGYGWTCRLEAYVWHQAGLCKVTRD